MPITRVTDLKIYCQFEHSPVIQQEDVKHVHRQTRFLSGHGLHAIAHLRRCVTRYQGDYKVKKFTCLDQYLCMAFAQITYRESLRDIEICLRAQEQKLYHMGVRGKVSRSTIADANEQRNWKIYADLAYALIHTARILYSDEPFAFELEQTAYALDATTIDLCLSMFPWANFRKNKGAVKLHTLLDLRCSIPTFIHISDGKLHEVNTLDIVPYETGSFYVMDRGYLDYSRLYTLSQALAFFLIGRNPIFSAGESTASRGSLNRPDLRPDHPAHRLLSKKGLSGKTATHQIPRRRKQSYSCISDQQLQSAGPDHYRALSLTLAGGTLFQMDQTTPAYQKLLRNIGECRQDANLDRHLRLRYCGYPEKTTSAPLQSLQYFTDSQCLCFRKNATLSTIYKNQLQSGKPYVV